MVAAIDDIVAATCRRRLPRRRRMRAACRSAGGSRRQRRITGRSPLPPRASTAASAAAPTTSATIVARRPLSRPAARPRRPEPAPAGDRSHRRVDAGRGWVRARGTGNPAENSGCYLKVVEQSFTFRREDGGSVLASAAPARSACRSSGRRSFVLALATVPACLPRPTPLGPAEHAPPALVDEAAGGCSA